MNMKITAGVILVIAALVVFLGIGKFAKPPSASGTATADEASVLSTQTDAALADQVSAIPDSSSDFATSAQNDIASDSSQFLYQ